MHRALIIASASMAALLQPGAAQATGPWIALHGITGAEIETIMFNPAAPANGLAGSDAGGLFRTGNGGASWTRAAIGSPGEVISALAIAPAASGVVYAGSYGLASTGVVRASQDGGATWTATAGQPAAQFGLFVSGMIAAGAGATVVVSDDNSGIFLTTNGGASWTNPLPDVIVAGLAASATASGTIWAAGAQAGGPLFYTPYAWVSTDGGARLPCPACRVAPSPATWPSNLAATEFSSAGTARKR